MSPVASLSEHRTRVEECEAKVAKLEAENKFLNEAYGRVCSRYAQAGEQILLLRQYAKDLEGERDRHKRAFEQLTESIAEMCAGWI